MADALIRNLKFSAAILEVFDPKEATPLPDFVTEYLKQGHKTLPLDQQQLILGVCAGCLKHHKILGGVTQPFIRLTKRTILRRDLRLFQVIAYFLLFLNVVYSTTVVQAVLSRLYTFSVRRFLLFFSGLEEANRNVGKQDRPMHAVVRQNWYTNFDRDFVDINFYGPYCRYEEELRGVVAAVEATYKNEARTRKTSITTVAQPFTFKTSDRKIMSEARLLSRQTPLKEKKRKLPVMFFAKIVPPTTYAPSADTIKLQVLAKERTEKIAIVKTRIDQRELDRPQLAAKDALLNMRDTTMKEKTVPHLLAQIRSEEMPEGIMSNATKPKLKIKKVKKLRKTIRGPPVKPVKQTTAALLREKALFQKHKDTLQKKTEELAAGAWDPNAFETRFRQLEERDLEAAIVESERKIIDVMQSLEKAIAAKKAYDEETRLKAVSEKELQRDLREQRRVEMDENIANLRGAVEMAQAVSQAQLGEAKRRVLVAKQEKAQLVKEENNELYHRYLDQCEEDLTRRRAIIAKIQEMDARISAYVPTFDFGAVREYGSLTDMSLADLQDQLIALRFEVMESLSRKREKILDEKVVFRQNLVEARDFVERERPQWEEEKRLHGEKAKKLKELRESAHNLPNVAAVRGALLLLSQERRKQRVTQRESLLKIRDSAWDSYFYA